MQLYTGGVADRPNANRIHDKVIKLIKQAIKCKQIVWYSKYYNVYCTHEGSKGKRTYKKLFDFRDKK